MARSALALALAMGPVFAQQLSDDQRQELDRFVETGADGPGPGLGHRHRSRRRANLRGLRGYAELGHGSPIDDETRFNIASNAKQFTAVCVLKLIQEGRLWLDDDVRTYLPEYYPDIDAPITIAGLLNHTTGIRDVYDLWALTGKTWWKLFVRNRDALELIQAQRALDFEPGSDHQYSNSNYLLLTEVIAHVTGGAFTEYADALFRELGMTSTAFLTNYMTVVPNKARSYGNWSGWKEYPAITGIHGDGGLYTTLGDQLTWESLIQTGGGDGYAGLIEASQRPVDGAEYQGHGFGVEFGMYRGLESVHHAGSTGAYSAFFCRYPSERLSVVVMSNSGRVSSAYVARYCSQVVLGTSSWPPSIRMAPMTRASRLHYHSWSATTVQPTAPSLASPSERATSTETSIRTIPSGWCGNRATYSTSKRTRHDGWPSSSVGVDGVLTDYTGSREPSVATRLPDDELEDGYVSELDGRYLEPDTGTEIILRHKNDRTFALIKNGRERDAELVRRDYLRMNSYRIRVSRGSDQAVVGLDVDNNRIRNVRFQREK